MEISKAAGKLFADYARLSTTKEFLSALEADMGIPISALIQQVKGGKPEYQGTWVHPQIAINLAQWASPKFAVLVSKWVFEWMSGNVPNRSKLPYHIQRYLINRSEIRGGLVCLGILVQTKEKALTKLGRGFSYIFSPRLKSLFFNNIKRKVMSKFIQQITAGTSGILADRAKNLANMAKNAQHALVNSKQQAVYELQNEIDKLTANGKVFNCNPKGTEALLQQYGFKRTDKPRLLLCSTHILKSKS
jgi:hypothetical protein